MQTVVAACCLVIVADAAAGDASTAYEGRAVRIGKGSAHTVVRVDAGGQPTAIAVVFTPGALKGLPKAAKGGNPDFPYSLPMPKKGPRTVVDHVVVNWESAGHPPAHVYDVPHFDFHFYLVDQMAQKGVSFRSENDSADPAQQPAAEHLPAGYVLPPGTAVPGMGVHAINPVSGEFKGKPFDATFIYGYYDKQLTFLEPMASLAYLRSRPSFSAPVPRPAAYARTGLYPSAYGVRYDAKRKVYEVSLDELQ